MATRLKATRARKADRDDASQSTGPVAVGAVPPDYVEKNRAAWDRWALHYTATGRKAWTEKELRWGIWGVAESELGLLQDLPAGADVIELGCGTASVSSWVARGGFRPVAVDVSRPQLEVAERLQEEFGLSFPLIHANAEEVPYDTDSFDLAISEYGASLWCEPNRWLAEADRLLRPGGGLIFVTNSPLLMACTPESGERAGDRLLRDYFTSPVREYPDGVVEFHLTHGGWIEILRAYGFAVERLVELRPPHGTQPRFDFVSIEWARRWPSEEIWVARKTT
jgi:ubiquinone/menaquinone biosynthesis C-methylase UbiE